MEWVFSIICVFLCFFVELSVQILPPPSKKNVTQLQEDVHRHMSTRTVGHQMKEQENTKNNWTELGLDKQGSLEWLRRGHLNRDGERIIIN